MSFQENKKMGTGENIIVTTISSSGSSSATPFIADKRKIPLIYMQPSVKSSNTVSSSQETQSVVPCPTALSNVQNSANGVNGKVVQVQAANQVPTIAYIGTLIRPGIIRKDPLRQKVLLTPIQDKGKSVKRFILPRTSQNVMKVVLPQTQGKAVCRNYLLQATVPNTALKPTTVLGKGPVSIDPTLFTTQKQCTPNIIRQKTVTEKTTFLPPITKIKTSVGSITVSKPAVNNDNNGVKIKESETSIFDPPVNITSPEPNSVSQAVLTPFMLNALPKPQPENVLFHEVVTIDDGGCELKLDLNKETHKYEKKVENKDEALGEVKEEVKPNSCEDTKEKKVLEDMKQVICEDVKTGVCEQEKQGVCEQENQVYEQEEQLVFEHEKEIVFEEQIVCEDEILKVCEDEKQRSDEKEKRDERSDIKEEKCDENTEELQDVKIEKSGDVKKESCGNVEGLTEINETEKSSVKEELVEDGEKVDVSKQPFAPEILPKNESDESNSLTIVKSEDNQVAAIEENKISQLINNEIKKDDDNKQSNDVLPEECSVKKLKKVSRKQNENKVTEVLLQKEKISKVREPVSSNIPSTTVEGARKRKGQLSNDWSKKSNSLFTAPEVNQYLPGAEEIDPIDAIDWDANGLGKLPGSDLKVILNEFGLLELFEEPNMKLSGKGLFDDSKRRKKEKDPDEIFCCLSCKCYGLISEFYSESFCSKACKDAFSLKQAVLRKRGIEHESEFESKKKRKFFQFGYYSKRSEKSETKSEDSEDVNEVKIKEECSRSDADVISIDDDSDGLSPSGYQESLLDNMNQSDEKDGNASKPILKMKKNVKKGWSVEGSLPRTYSKLDKKNKFNLRQREVGDRKLSEEKGFSENEIIQIGESPKKLDSKKRSSTETSSCKNRDKGWVDFPWSTYLTETLSRPAWVKLFQNPYPICPNTFRIGYKLEAIDPEHQSYFCAVTVVEVKGFRLKLHFDGYSACHDFWINADSPNIFPCGFCSRKGIPLQPPWGYNAETFSWQSYLSSWKARSAPLNCFHNYRQVQTSQNLFRTGMKLEAVDRKNSYLVCVATVSAILGNRILVHFDSWGDVYDYWAETSSPYIHYVGWCKETKHVLTPPNGIKPSEFDWEKYLKDSGSIAAPRRAFTLRPHVAFKKGYKLEAVDKRAPHLLRVATIKEVLPYQIKIVFDGFPDHFGYWVDDDCPDIHPVGWGNKTGHTLEPPPKENALSSCPTSGCLGQGHSKGLKFETHSCTEDCPYSLDNLLEDDLVPDRLTEKPCLFESLSNTNLESESLMGVDDDISGGESDDEKIRRWDWMGVREREKESRSKYKMNKKTRCKPIILDSCKDVTEDALIDKNMEETPRPMKVVQDELTSMVEQSCLKQHWTPPEVNDFVENLLKKTTKVFIEEEIDGESFLMLTQDDLSEQLGFKLGDSIKLFNSILLLREKVT